MRASGGPGGSGVSLCALLTPFFLSAAQAPLREAVGRKYRARAGAGASGPGPSSTAQRLTPPPLLIYLLPEARPC